MPEAVDLLHTEGVMEANADQCQYGLMTQDTWGEGFAMKPTKFLTNSIAIQANLSRRCCGGHRHIPLLGGKAKAAGICPTPLLDSILDATHMEAQRGREENLMLLGRLDVGTDMCDPAEARALLHPECRPEE